MEQTRDPCNLKITSFYLQSVYVYLVYTYIYITCIYFYLDLYDWLCFMIFFWDPFGHLWRVVQIRNTFQCPVLRLSRHGRRVARLEPENCIWCLISDSFCSSSTINDMIWYDLLSWYHLHFMICLLFSCSFLVVDETGWGGGCAQSWELDFVTPDGGEGGSKNPGFQQQQW